MGIIYTILEQINGFFGMTGLLEIIKTGNYQSLLTYQGITSALQPLLPLVLVLELVRGLLYRKFNVINYKIPLFSYIKENSSAEIEFLVQKDGDVLPIEVKNNNTQAKSLAWFRKFFEPKLSFKLSNKMGSLEPGIVHFPIYACENLIETHLKDL